MDISRSIFPVSHPRLRLDAGTHATMGVGMGYAIAAHIAYNGLGSQPGEAQVGPSGLQGASKKKIVCLEGDSAFGFSAMEVETMARYGMDVLIFVINNGGVYHGDADSRARWEELQQSTLSPGSGPTSPSEGGANPGLRSTSLSFGTAYQNLATMVGGLGIEARTIAEVERATREGWACGKVCVVNVLVGKGEGGKLAFGWQQAGPSARKSTGGGSNGGGGEERREKGKGGRGARL